jgi:gentisate 1,2-dioxygenase
MGQGESTIDGEVFAWSRGDCLAVPVWRPHSHIASQCSVLLRVSDEPLLKPLDLLREELLTD